MSDSIESQTGSWHDLPIILYSSTTATVSFGLARNNVFCRNFVNTWNFCLKKMSFKGIEDTISKVCKFYKNSVLTENTAENIGGVL